MSPDSSTTAKTTEDDEKFCSKQPRLINEGDPSLLMRDNARPHTAGAEQKSSCQRDCLSKLHRPWTPGLTVTKK